MVVHTMRRAIKKLDARKERERIEATARSTEQVCDPSEEILKQDGRWREQEADKTERATPAQAARVKKTSTDTEQERPSTKPKSAQSPKPRKISESESDDSASVTTIDTTSPTTPRSNKDRSIEECSELPCPSTIDMSAHKLKVRRTREEIELDGMRGAHKVVKSDSAPAQQSTSSSSQPDHGSLSVPASVQQQPLLSPILEISVDEARYSYIEDDDEDDDDDDSSTTDEETVPERSQSPGSVSQDGSSTRSREQPQNIQVNTHRNPRFGSFSMQDLRNNLSTILEENSPIESRSNRALEAAFALRAAKQETSPTSVLSRDSSIRSSHSNASANSISTTSSAAGASPVQESGSSSQVSLASDVTTGQKSRASDKIPLEKTKVSSTTSKPPLKQATSLASIMTTSSAATEESDRNLPEAIRPGSRQIAAYDQLNRSQTSLVSQDSQGADTGKKKKEKKSKTKLSSRFRSNSSSDNSSIKESNEPTGWNWSKEKSLPTSYGSYAQTKDYGRPKQSSFPSSYGSYSVTQKHKRDNSADSIHSSSSPRHNRKSSFDNVSVYSMASDVPYHSPPPSRGNTMTPPSNYNWGSIQHSPPQMTSYSPPMTYEPQPVVSPVMNQYSQPLVYPIPSDQYLHGPDASLSTSDPNGVWTRTYAPESKFSRTYHQISRATRDHSMHGGNPHGTLAGAQDDLDMRVFCATKQSFPCR